MFSILDMHSDNADFCNQWSIYLNENHLGPLYCLEFIEFLHTISKSGDIDNKSFIITSKGKPVAIVPVIVESYENRMQISSRGGYIPIWHISGGYGEKTRKKIKKIIDGYFSEIVKQNNVSAVHNMICPLSEFRNQAYYNRLTDEGYLDMSSSTIIIDLQIDEKLLWSNVRKSYRNLINTTNAAFKCCTLDGHNFEGELFNKFPLLYKKAAGFEVYGQNGWKIVADMIKNGHGVISFVETNSGQIAGAAFFMVNNGKAYYTMGATSPEVVDEAIGHLYIWKSIKYFIDKAYSYLELGWQDVSCQLLHQPSPKEVNIAMFKRGFGGIRVPLFRGVKFYDSSLSKDFINTKTDSYFKRLVYEN